MWIVFNVILDLIIYCQYVWYVLELGPDPCISVICTNIADPSNRLTQAKSIFWSLLSRLIKNLRFFSNGRKTFYNPGDCSFLCRTGSPKTMGRC